MVMMNMPVAREKELENQTRGGDGNPSIYKPLPDEEGIFTNELVIGLMTPGRWKLFNPDQNMIDMYSMTGAGLHVNGEELVTFYLKIPVHGIPNYKRQDGTTGYTYVVCPHAMNEYVVNTFGGAPIFHDSVQCAFCQERDKWWEVSNSRWGDLGLGVWDLKGDARVEKIKSDPILNNASKMARKYRVSERYVMSVYDYSKQNGSRALDEGQAYVNMQVWFAPKKVFEALRSHYEEGWDFWNLDRQDGVQIVKVTKDMTEVTKQNPWKVGYALTMAPQRVQIQPEIINYIKDPNNQVDPSNFVVVASYEAMAANIANSNEPTQSASYNSAPSAPNPAAGTPGMPNMPLPQSLAPATPVTPQTTAPVVPPPSAPAIAPPTIPTAPVTSAQPPSPPTPSPAEAPRERILPPPTVPVVPNQPTMPTAPAQPPAPTQAAGPPIPGQAPPPVSPNPIPSVQLPDRTPPQDGSAAPPITVKGTPGLGGQSW